MDRYRMSAFRCSRNPATGDLLLLITGTTRYKPIFARALSTLWFSSTFAGARPASAPTAAAARGPPGGSAGPPRRTAGAPGPARLGHLGVEGQRPLPASELGG